ncbi:MAG: DUF484 family protein [Roseinatronobacter sp.]|nr:DUF484 family protein [Roseinatronobacter sp.]
MTGTALRPDQAEEFRATILADPTLILDDKDLMRTLVAASERGMGDNIIDLRGLAMERLEARLDRLEETHRAVIAAAYENLSGTNQIHRAILRMLDPDKFEEFLRNLGGDVAQILNVDAVKLVLESSDAGSDPALARISDVLCVMRPGFSETYMSSERGPTSRQVVLRQSIPQTDVLYGARMADLRSEACMRLDLGAGRMGGMLVMASENPHMFKPGQGTDLLALFAGIFERAMRRWLA